MSLILQNISETAREAGAIIRSHFEHLDRSQIHNKDVRDLVTDADREVECFIREKLSVLHPEVGFLGEESGGADLDSGKVFSVDPIDGTTSFVHGHPFHCVSIGYMEDGAAVAGAVYLPCFDQLYTAERGKGARKDGKPIHVSLTDKMINALGATGYGCVCYRAKPDNVSTVAEMVYKLRGIRTCGSAAIDLCYVAEGKYDAYWEFRIKPWDWCAGALIVEEAGGKVTGFDGRPPVPEVGRVLATNGRLHDDMLEVICKHL